MRSRDCDVVLVRRTIDLGCWEFGMGRERGGNGEGEVSLRATWGQGGRDRTTQREGFQVSKRELTKKRAMGAKKGNCATTLYCQSMCMYIMIV
jgi:hypothetical protein